MCHQHCFCQSLVMFICTIKNNKQIAKEDREVFQWFNWRREFLIAVKGRGFSFLTQSGVFQQLGTFRVTHYSVLT